MGSVGKIDRNRVTRATEAERLYWETKLGASREALWRALDEVGDEPDAVRRYLATKRPPPAKSDDTRAD